MGTAPACGVRIADTVRSCRAAAQRQLLSQERLEGANGCWPVPVRGYKPPLQVLRLPLVLILVQERTVSAITRAEFTVRP